MKYYIIVIIFNKYDFPWMSSPTFSNKPFIILLQISYPTTGSYLSWVKLFMVKLTTRTGEAGTIWWIRQFTRLEISRMVWFNTFPKHLWKIKLENINHFDPVVHSIKTSTPVDAKELSNPKNNTRSSADFCKTTSPVSPCRDKNIASNKN